MQNIFKADTLRHLQRNDKWVWAFVASLVVGRRTERCFLPEEELGRAVAGGSKGKFGSSVRGDGFSSAKAVPTIRRLTRSVAYLRLPIACAVAPLLLQLLECRSVVGECWPLSISVAKDSSLVRLRPVRVLLFFEKPNLVLR